MHKFVRPALTANFSKRVRTARLKVRNDIKTGSATVDFPPRWSKVKDTFMAAQEGKCGFCEGLILGLQYGDVEHYRPKGAVEILDHANPGSWGQEAPWSAVVKGRTLLPHSAIGYWWKAYSWSNYLIVCQICNQQWKQCLFPTADPLPRLPPTIGIAETALLLNPFEDFEPHEHFAFGRMGEVTGLTEKGRATILTCGLDRPSLRRARQDLAYVTHQRIDEISADITTYDLLVLLQAIAGSGEGHRPHCGMVRAIFHQRMDMPWETLLRLVKKLGEEAAAHPPRRLCLC